MPLENPKSPVQHPHHRVSGFSIPGRLPCLLAVVLGLFAHHGGACADPSLGPPHQLDGTDRYRTGHLCPRFRSFPGPKL